MNPSDVQSNAPWFPFFPADWLSSMDVMLMNCEERGQYIQLLAVCWNDKDCSIPDDAVAMALLSGCQTVSEKVRGKFEQHPYKEEALTNPRLMAERVESVEFKKNKSRAGAKGAKARWQSHKNANGSAKDLPIANGIANDAPSPTPTPTPTQKKNKTLCRENKFSDEDMNFVLEMRRKISTIKPDFKFRGSEKSWAEDIRKMREIDKRDPGKIQKVFEWANADSFWSSNILSAGKLREKFDVLELRMNGNGNGFGGSDPYACLGEMNK